KGPSNSIASLQVVTGSEEMSGVDAHTETLGIAAATQDECEFLKRPAGRRPLPRGGLQRNPSLDLGHGLEDSIQAGHHLLEPHFNSLAHMGAGMEHKKWKAQALGHDQFFLKRAERQVVEGGVARREIDKIPAMAKNAPKRIA